MATSLVLLIVLAAIAVIVVPCMLGVYLARWLRMPDYGWKLGLIFFVFVASVVVICVKWPPKLGIDLSGGARMVYEIDLSKTPPGQSIDMGKLLEALARRINPSGVKEVTLRPYGINQVEVQVPNVNSEELAQMKSLISRQGSLEFRILANDRDHKELVKLAKAETETKQIRDRDGELLGWWVPLAEKGDQGIKTDPENIWRTREVPKTADHPEGKITEVLVANDDYSVTGADLSSASAGQDLEGPKVHFAFNSQGAYRFGQLTGRNVPDEVSGFKRKLGIILDGQLYNAPFIKSKITDQGEISGMKDKKEVDETVAVLNAGSLPATLSKEPISEVFIGPSLGGDTIRSSTRAMIISAILVPLFMLWYYRFAGMVANVALVLNMVVLVAVMIIVHAAFTLTGLAGLALGVGMAVDNNVLLYERMREELHRGATIRMAIRNAFHRVGVVIVDANLTHLIAASVLFFVGTEQVKGFAVTFWLGAVLSMWTSMFVARVIFEIAERKRWLTKLKMLHVIGDTHIDFMAWFPVCLTFSILITVAGVLVAFHRGKGLFDIDFTGGVSVQTVFRDPQDIGKIRAVLDPKLKDLAVSDVRLEGKPANTEFLINTSEQDPVAVRKELKAAFGDKLVTNSVEVTALAPIEAGKASEKAAPKAAEPPAKTKEPPAKTKEPPTAKPQTEAPATKAKESPAAKPQAKPENKPAAKPAPKPAEKHSRNDLPPDSMLAMAGPAAIALADAKPDAKPEAKSPPPPASKTTAAPAERPLATGAPAVADAFAGGSRCELKFDFDVNHKTAEDMVRAALEASGIDVEQTPPDLTNADYVEGSNMPSFKWTLRIKLPPAKAAKVLETLQRQVRAAPYFPSASAIGSAVAQGTQLQAIYALVASWTLIIIYLWVRFQGAAFGLAAVIALIHDVFVMLGGIAFSYYIAPYFGFLMIDPFKINLAIVAAFLTIIGYSVNDTIVVFDRIREVRGKDPRMTRQMVNDSTNQTLSRTLLTSFTVMLVVVILYIAGGKEIHGFAFALIIGVLTGTYSSIYVAAPILLWLIHPKAMRNAPAE